MARNAVQSLIDARASEVHPNRLRKWNRADAAWVYTCEEPDYSDPKNQCADPVYGVEPESRWWLCLYSPETLARLQELGLA